MDYYAIKELIINAIESILKSSLLGGFGGILGIGLGIVFAIVFGRYLKPGIQLVFRKVNAWLAKKRAQDAIDKITDPDKKGDFDENVDKLP